MNVPAAIHAHLRMRERRDARLGSDLFGEPAWDMLLDLTLARIEGRRVLVKGAVIASRSPVGTAQRHLNNLERAGFLIRLPDPIDRRRVFLEISDDAAGRIVDLFGSAGAAA